MKMLEESKAIIICAVCQSTIREKQMVISRGPMYLCKHCYKERLEKQEKKNKEAKFMQTAERNRSNGYSGEEQISLSFFEQYHAFPPLQKDRSISPKEIVEFLNRNIIGQEKAKKTLAVAVYNHYRRIHQGEGREMMPKSNILIQGPSGSGKTFLLKNLAKLLDVPFTIADASTLTEAGYRGKDMESILTALYHAAGQDIAKAQKGIVYLDEFDKLSSHMGRYSSDGGACVGEGVQRQMLKMIEGCEMDIPRNGTRMGNDTIKINTENILFICGGAFVGIGKKEEDVKRIIGFYNEVSEEETVHTEKKLTTQDFIDYGLIPEVVGRLPIIVELEALTEMDLMNILKNSESSFIKSYQAMLKEDEIELVFEEDAIREIARMAYAKNVGARGLNAIVEGIMEALMYDIPSDATIRRCVITKQVVCGEENPQIERMEEISL